MSLYIEREHLLPALVPDWRAVPRRLVEAMRVYDLAFRRSRDWEEKKREQERQAERERRQRNESKTGSR